MCKKSKLGFKIYSLSNNNNYEFYTEELPIIDNSIKVDDETAQFLFDFFCIFAIKTYKVDDNHVSLVFQSFISFSSIMKNNLDNLVKTYKSICPKLNSLKKYFENIQEDEIFCILPVEKIIDTKAEIEIFKILHRLNNKEFIEIDQFFKLVIEDYNIKCYGDITKKIGHKDKINRICRWCHKSMKTIPAVSFNEKAHAISEALGNKNLFLYDECDECNHTFARTIESDFITTIQVLNVAWGVPGKNGIPKIKTHNLEIKNNSSNTLSINNESKIKPQKPFSFSYNAGMIKSQNIYRALCKFALSVLEDETILNQFQWTTDWISNKRSLSKVPIIYKALIGGFSKLNPIIQLHIRKNQKNEFPILFAIFYHRDLVFFYIIPSTEQEAEYYANKENFESFWKILPYSKFLNWEKVDFSDDIPRKTIINLNFIPNK